jgi:oligo-1,6-glucosidase
MNDIESLGNYRALHAKGYLSEEEGLAMLRKRSRDNARTPMQWDAGPNAGFTDGTPWLAVNPNHKTINAAEQLARPDSVFHYYQKLISLRKELDVIIYGHYELLEPEHPELFAYVRSWENDRLLTVCSWAEHELNYTVPAEFLDGECLISNYPDPHPESGVLRPWECFVLLKRGEEQK